MSKSYPIHTFNAINATSSMNDLTKWVGETRETRQTKETQSTRETKKVKEVSNVPFDFPLSHGGILVTNNVEHFKKIGGLSYENWLEE